MAELIKACKYGNTDNVKFLLQSKQFDPSDDNNMAIRVASFSHNPEIVKLLLSDPRVNPAAGNNEAIKNACLECNLEIVKLLLKDSRVDPSVDKNFSLEVTSSRGQYEIVKLLLKDQRVDPTAGMRGASLHNHIDIIKLIMIKRCNIIKEELMMKTWHPLRIEKLLLAGYDIEDI